MERIGVRELRQHASRYLERVKAGETLEVSERGRLVALLVPASASASARDRLVAAGAVVPSSEPWSPPARVVADGTTAEALDELRADR